MKAALLVVFLAAVGLMRPAAADDSLGVGTPGVATPAAAGAVTPFAAAVAELPAASYSRTAELIKGMAESRQAGT